MLTILCRHTTMDPTRTYRAGSTYVCTKDEYVRLQKDHPTAFVLVQRAGPARRDKAIHLYKTAQGV